MKRLATAFVLAAVISTLLGGCAPAETKVYSDPAQTIEVKVDQSFIIALDENPTTGYRLQEEFDDSFLKLVEGKFEPPPEPKEGELPMVGAPGIRSFEFKALKKGRTEITMVAKQPWEGGSAGQKKTFTVNIN